MGAGAIIILVLLAVLAMSRCNDRFSEGDNAGAIVTGLLFTIAVAIIIIGNPWIWAAWQGLVAAKTLFSPSDETVRIRSTMPPGVFTASLLTSVVMSGLIFVAFQWLR